MFNIGKLTTDLLNSIDNVAKETLEEPKESATYLRSKRKSQNASNTEEDDLISTNSDAGNTEEISNSLNTQNQIETKSSLFNVNSSHSIISDTPPLPVPDVTTTIKKTFSFKSTGNTEINTSNLDTDLKSLLKKKNQEIEKLNSECLELEESNQALKTEIEDVWTQYRQLQDKYVVRENELVEEIKEVQKSKNTDKQQYILNMSQLNSQIEEFKTKLSVLNQEKDNLLSEMNVLKESSESWTNKESQYLTQIQELRQSTVQGASQLREEYMKEKESNTIMRLDYEAIIRQKEDRFQELEGQLIQTQQYMTNQANEIQQLKNLLNSTGGYTDFQTLSSQYESLLQEYNTNMKVVDDYKDIIVKHEQTIKRLEYELKVQQVKYDENNLRNNDLLQLSDKRIIELESKLKQLETSTVTVMNVNMNSTTPREDDIMSNSSTTAATTTTISGNNTNNNNQQSQQHQKITQLMEQLQNISKQLLTKQEQYMEIQTEKSILKSRINDLQERCTKAEQELQRIKELEDGYDHDDTDINEQEISTYNIHNLSFTSIQSMQRDPAVTDYTTGSRSGLTHRGNILSTPTITPSKYSYPYVYSLQSKTGGSSSSSNNHRRRDGKIIRDLEQIGLHTTPAIAQAVSFVDGCTLWTGRFLRNHSFVRIGFVLYLLFLHIWVFFILIIHIHSIDSTDTTTLIQNNIKNNPFIQSNTNMITKDNIVNS